MNSHGTMTSITSNMTDTGRRGNFCRKDLSRFTARAARRYIRRTWRLPPEAGKRSNTTLSSPQADQGCDIQKRSAKKPRAKD